MRSEDRLRTVLEDLAPEVDQTGGWRGVEHHIARFRRRRWVFAAIGTSLGLIAVVGLVAVLSNPPNVEVADPLPRPASTDPSLFYLSDFQRAILEDGEVTLDEIESAVSHFNSCLSDAGLDVTAEVDPAGSYSLTSGTPPDNPEYEPFNDSAYAPCLIEYFSKLGQVWVDQHYDPEEDQAFYEAVVTCLRQQGLPVEDSRPSTLDIWIKQEPVLYNQCLDQTTSQFRK